MSRATPNPKTASRGDRPGRGARRAAGPPSSAPWGMGKAWRCFNPERSCSKSQHGPRKAAPGAARRCPALWPRHQFLIAQAGAPEADRAPMRARSPAGKFDTFRVCNLPAQSEIDSKQFPRSPRPSQAVERTQPQLKAKSSKDSDTSQYSQVRLP